MVKKLINFFAEKIIYYTSFFYLNKFSVEEFIFNLSKLSNKFNIIFQTIKQINFLTLFKLTIFILLYVTLLIYIIII